jgi:hypothetical protein
MVSFLLHNIHICCCCFKFAQTYTAAQLGSLKELFQLCDEDKNGTISKGELGKVMSELGVSTTETEISLLFQKLDVNHDGALSFSEFVKGLNSLSNVSVSSFFLNFPSLVSHNTTQHTQSSHALPSHFSHFSLCSNRFCWKVFLVLPR